VVDKYVIKLACYHLLVQQLAAFMAYILRSHA